MRGEKLYTESDLKDAFQAGRDFQYCGGDDHEFPNFEKWFEREFCVNENGHYWVDKATDIGRFYCAHCGRYK